MAIKFMIDKKDFHSELKNILHSDPWSMKTLSAARSLQLPDWAIGGGFVRNRVWDRLSGREETRLNDVDLLFFDSDTPSKARDMEIEQSIRHLLPDIPWSVKNQARMHLRNLTRPYLNTEDAMRHWLETATAVAVRLDNNDDLIVLAPFGLSDLFNMIIRPTFAASSKMDQFETRIHKKNWLSIWPEVKIDKMIID